VIFAPVITGAIVNRSGQFSLAFMVARAVSRLGVIGYGIVVTRFEAINWAV
jgi:hypothetical protein